MRCGMIPSDLASLGLSPSSDGPSHKFPALEKALRGLGCPASLQEGLFAMLAAVAHLLNLNDREAARLLGCSHETLQKLLECTTSDCVARYLYAHLLRWLGQCELCILSTIACWVVPVLVNSSANNKGMSCAYKGSWYVLCFGCSGLAE